MTRRNYIKAELYKLDMAAKAEAIGMGYDPNSPKGFLRWKAIYKALREETYKARMRRANRAGL